MRSARDRRCIGIMQGRLGPPVEGRFQSFPRGRWLEEFGRAAAAGLDGIEWIYDVFGLEENLLAEDDGVLRLAEVASRHGVPVLSVCADYFLQRPLLKGEPGARRESREALAGLVRRAGVLGARRVVLPFVDASSLSGPSERADLAALLPDVLAETTGTAAGGVELHLETDLAPGPFADLLSRIPSPRVRVNYDSGNSASLGFSPRDEFAAYGPRVGSVHVKDRVRGGGTVPLGTGDTDFGALAEVLHRFSYRGDLILQAARGPEGDEVAWAVRNRAFVEATLLAGETA